MITSPKFAAIALAAMASFSATQALAVDEHYISDEAVVGGRL
ncbi:hypothetical protein [Roseovarius faecimaris]|nr:hypothetical protein [Roseovarius faecimaris]